MKPRLVKAGKRELAESPPGATGKSTLRDQGPPNTARALRASAYSALSLSPLTGRATAPLTHILYAICQATCEPMVPAPAIVILVKAIWSCRYVCGRCRRALASGARQIVEHRLVGRVQPRRNNQAAQPR